MFNPELIDTFKNTSTPFYFYDTDLLHKTLFAIKEAADLFHYNIHYAVKANANEKLLKIINGYGLGADCVSGNEIQRALECGFQPNKIVFAGVGKTDAEIKLAIQNRIFSINCESVEEIEVINSMAADLEIIPKLSLRINPNIDAKTHKNITTGLEENKFGLSINDLNFLIDNKDKFDSILINGIHFHIGSQISDLDVFRELCTKVNNIQKYMENRNFRIDHINLGGGLGIDYQMPENQIPDFQAYFNVFTQNLDTRAQQTFHFEPGRSIVGQSGILISKVLYVKASGQKKLLIIDAGFTELLRPALYQAEHKIVNLTSQEDSEVYDIAGPICETSDYFGRSIMLPKSKRGDIIAIMSAGAYGEAMASNYNLRPLVNKLYSDQIECAVKV